MKQKNIWRWHAALLLGLSSLITASISMAMEEDFLDEQGELAKNLVQNATQLSVFDLEPRQRVAINLLLKAFHDDSTISPEIIQPTSHSFMGEFNPINALGALRKTTFNSEGRKESETHSLQDLLLQDIETFQKGGILKKTKRINRVVEEDTLVADIHKFFETNRLRKTQTLNQKMEDLLEAQPAFANMIQGHMDRTQEKVTLTLDELQSMNFPIPDAFSSHSVIKKTLNNILFFIKANPENRLNILGNVQGKRQQDLSYLSTESYNLLDTSYQEQIGWAIDRSIPMEEDLENSIRLEIPNIVEDLSISIMPGSLANAVTTLDPDTIVYVLSTEATGKFLDSISQITVEEFDQLNQLKEALGALLENLRREDFSMAIDMEQEESAEKTLIEALKDWRLRLNPEETIDNDSWSSEE